MINDTKENKKDLIDYVAQSPYIKIDEQAEVCKQFGLHYLKNVFRNEYRKRFYNYLLLNLTTVATVSKVTGIPHHYLTECKAYFEKKGMLQVVYTDVCPTTDYCCSQFVTTNKQLFDRTDLAPDSNQINLFDND